MLPDIGFGELLVILAVGLLLFGADRIPQVARSIGKSVNAFKKGLKDSIDDDEEDQKKGDKKTLPPA
ncbi:MAG: twin-arginine translocase TatA/TatE family subunit [Elusimicrobia bacterium]|nr:twin-arginine translocase TatA/TatE family subunit [Elusimicrobiota bacterium]